MREKVICVICEIFELTYRRRTPAPVVASGDEFAVGRARDGVGTAEVDAAFVPAVDGVSQLFQYRNGRFIINEEKGDIIIGFYSQQR